MYVLNTFFSIILFIKILLCTKVIHEKINRLKYYLLKIIMNKLINLIVLKYK